MEDDLLKQLPVDRNSTSDQVYAALRQRIDQFRESLDTNGNNEELEDTYVSLANEIFDQSSQLEAKLFRDQTICLLELRKATWSAVLRGVWSPEQSWSGSR